MYGMATSRSHGYSCENEVVKQLADLQRRASEFVWRDGPAADRVRTAGDLLAHPRPHERGARHDADERGRLLLDLSRCAGSGRSGRRHLPRVPRVRIRGVRALARGGEARGHPEEDLAQDVAARSASGAGTQAAAAAARTGREGARGLIHPDACAVLNARVSSNRSLQL